MLLCDKCLSEVADHDDATILDAIVYGDNAWVFAHRPRHIRCSPSRAQYIVHPDFDPVIDDRESFDKRTKPTDFVSEVETSYTKAWIHLVSGGEDA